MLLFVDTETTGKLDFKLSLLHPSQPRLVQLAAWLGRWSEEKQAVEHVESMNEIVQPDGWTIPDDAAAIHGITTERARTFGKPLHEVLDRFCSLVEGADEFMSAGCFIAHNTAFDTRVMLGELARNGRDPALLNMLRPFCTMQSLTTRMKLPGKFRGTFKWPTLDEAYEFCFQKPIDNREKHEAMVDLLACKDIWEHGRREGWWQ